MMLKNFITRRIAGNGLIVILSLVIFFHLLVLSGIVPYDIVWGGRLANRDQMIVFEIVSITINALMLATAFIEMGYWKLNVSKKILRIILWIMGVVFFVNTTGNILSLNDIETIIFTPLTFVLAIFSFRLALDTSG